MLIVSGADLVGKSTVVQHTVKLLNEEYDLPHMPMHLARPPENFDSFDGYVDKMSRDTVWDRFHLDEIVYRQLDERRSSITPLKYELVDARLSILGGMVLVITAEDDVIRRRYEARGDQMYDLEHVLRVNHRFRDLTNCGWCDCRGQIYTPRVDGSFDLPSESDTDMEHLRDWVSRQVEAYVRRQLELAELLFAE